MKIALILGTRPEIIKLSPIMRELEKRKINYLVIHTNQHYSEGMDAIFFRELGLREPAYNLNIHDLPQGTMVGKMLIGLEPILVKEKPDWVLVQGDTNSVLAGALVAAKLQIKVGHVEAGLRSYDKSMPEELNRLVTDHISESLFCPTEKCMEIALGEGIMRRRIFMTGNTIVDAIIENQKLIPENMNNELRNQEYMLLTMHRAGNVDDGVILDRLIGAIQALSRNAHKPVYFPIHPRTATSLKKFGIVPDPALLIVRDPVGYIEMLSLMKNSKLIITDSGGVQEEACILRVPCITIRDNTERPETVKVGANRIVGSDVKIIVAKGLDMLNIPRTWSNPYGDGHAAEKIINQLLK